MIRHFFLDKTNTIIKDRQQNFGLNPILSIGYGNGIMRGLIHFDISQIKALIDDKTFANIDKLSFNLKMTNCFSVAGVPYEAELNKGKNKTAKRASSFDLMLFELPVEFDQGRGFDYIDDFWIHDTRAYSTEGSTWYQSKTNTTWNGKFKKEFYPKNEVGGILPQEVLEEEYEKYIKGEDSIIISTQHFDFGDEMLTMDITKYVLKSINSNTNFGLCLSFVPSIEVMEREELQVVDFFTDHTNTFFHPYIEATYDEHIVDSRDSFIIGETSRLYLYVYDNGELTNLDVIPTCSIDEIYYPVFQASKGVYYAEVNSNLEKDMIYYDVWSDIYLNNERLEDVELEFVANGKMHNRMIGNKSTLKQNLVPIIYGINDNEDLGRGEHRELTVKFQEKYTNNEIITKKSEYRLYVKDGDREIDVISYQPLEMAFLNNFFIIHTEDLIPNKYFIDIKVSIGREIMTYKNILNFNIVSNVTERYQ